MSYPDPRYLGDQGEISARVRRAGEEPDLMMATGTASYLATGPPPMGSSASTGGSDGITERARPPFPPQHLRVVLRSVGDGAAVQRESWTDATAGDFLYVPEGGVHAFRNDSGEPASMLILFAPGAPRDAYFEGLADLGRLSEEGKTEFFIRHDTYSV